MQQLMERETQTVATQTQPFSLPLVSIIVINFNYGRFLPHAIESIFAQTYPHIECIIVDDSSTDNSEEILQQITQQYPMVTILRRRSNGGQSMASKDGFEASNGEYIVFLDADDFLLPHFIETHIFIHLSSRIPVGVTSSNVLQSMGSRIVLGTFHSINKLILKQKKKSKHLLHRIDRNTPNFWPLPSPDETLEEQIYYHHPKKLKAPWHWAPTSGNCFRRDALLYFLNNDQLHLLLYSTDAYLLRAVSLLTGSIIIDRSLAIYRMHGTNAFSNHPHLHGVLNFEKGKTGDFNPLSNQLIKEHLIKHAPLFLKKMELTKNRRYVHWLLFCSNLVKRFRKIK